MTTPNENFVSPFATTPGADVPSGTPFTEAEAQAAEVQASAAKVTQEAAPVNPNALIIPDYSVDAAPTMGKLVAAQFEHVATLSGAAKLADSAVAPLIAAARGYSTVTPDNLKAAAEKLGVKLNSTHGKQLKMASEIDALLMPWYNLTAVSEARTTGGALASETYQLRPAMPGLDAKGKPRPKYLMPAGKDTILGLHPATPASWVASAPRVLIAEGLLKADSAMSAHLIANGISETDLLAQHGGNADAARPELTRLMEGIPEENRVLIIGVASCTTWAGKIAWASTPLKGRQVWIGMDGDVATNIAVWNQAHGMKKFLKTKNAGSIGIVTLPPVDGDDRAGVDDFFAAGHSWAELEAAVGELPEAPEIDLKVSDIELASIDMDAALTYEMKNVDVDGTPELKASALAEAAVTITRVETTRSVFEGFGSSQKISGEVAWRVRTAGGKQKRRRSFVEQDMNLLIGARATAPVALNELSYGAAGGAVVRHGAGPQALAAWAETIGRAKVTEVIETTGLWNDSEGTLGYLTVDGHFTADGINPDLKAKMPGRTPDIEIPWIDHCANPQEIVEAWEQAREAFKVIHPAHGGLSDLVTGMSLAVAVGLKPKGTLALFCDPESGKTFLLRLLGGWFGKDWHSSPSLILEATPAAISSTLEDCNNVMLSMDDARDKGDETAFKALKKIADSAARVGHDEKASHMKSRRDAMGNWRVPPALPHAAKASILAGEDLESLELKDSTVSRMLSFQTTKAEPLLRKRGEIGPILEEMTRTGALSKLMGAFLVRELTRAEATGSENPREALLEPLRKATQIELERLTAINEGPSIRDAELLAPALVAVHSLNTLVAEAYTILGRVAEAEAVLKGTDTSREAMLGAWRRHRTRWASEARDTAAPLLSSIAAALASGRVQWGSASHAASGISPVIGREDVTAKGIPNQLVLLQDEVVALLKNFGMKDMSSTKLVSALRPVILEKSQVFSIGGKRARGILIGRDTWEAACGAQDPVEEAVAITQQAAPKAQFVASQSAPETDADGKDWEF